MAGILPHISAMIIKWMYYTHLLIDRCSDCLKPNNSRSCYILLKRDIPEIKQLREVENKGTGKVITGKGY